MTIIYFLPVLASENSRIATEHIHMCFHQALQAVSEIFDQTITRSQTFHISQNRGKSMITLRLDFSRSFCYFSCIDCVITLLKLHKRPKEIASVTEK